MDELVSPVSRPHPARLTPATYPIQSSLEARYGDMDANGHLNNVALGSMHENTRASLHLNVLPGAYDRGARRIRVVTVSNVLHYLREAHWPATIRAAAGIGHIGRTSFVTATALFVDEACVSLCDAVLVVLDDDGPTPIPDDMKIRMTAARLMAAE